MFRGGSAAETFREGVGVTKECFQESNGCQEVSIGYQPPLLTPRFDITSWY